MDSEIKTLKQILEPQFLKTVELIKKSTRNAQDRDQASEILSEFRLKEKIVTNTIYALENKRAIGDQTKKDIEKWAKILDWLTQAEKRLHARVSLATLGG